MTKTLLVFVSYKVDIFYKFAFLPTCEAVMYS